MNNIPLIDLRAQYLELKDEIDEAIRRVMDSGEYIAGPEVEALEKEIAATTESSFAVAVGNGTDALALALEAAGIGPGDEVITTAFTFFATAEAIVRRGAVPVFADIDKTTYNLCPEDAERRITNRTKAILPVHVFGQPAEMDAFADLAARHGLVVIEDACQSIGATYKGRQVGAIGDIGCISFFPTKNLGGYGDGGIVVTSDERAADRVRLLARHGSRKKYFHEAIGVNSRLDPLQAAIIRVKLARLHDWNERRRQAAEYYNTGLRDTPLRLPAAPRHAGHVYHLYVTQFHGRDALATKLSQDGISTGHYYPCPLHLQKALAGLGYKQGDLPVTETACAHSFALPLSPHLTKEQQDYIIGKVMDYTQGW
ncbi:DegT/DnrJ/EryC1/StrS family aminotransferase [Paenibacillus sp. LHD-117]|uniref:DegT/DnrJ/EryC1/StrS family aminotransferase n=1 Tax=Paenibacillus sp. LHD-117 TaxID=3071412 RepID=UPI0027E05EB9|nr:DegT/DnrJ/EryC1/StrS family aminotransferase [Paenibacillus sp. LHD-117]MDQ6418336.1 DegT/DnrJ/EryC1/StrS family aminotransferase [Paenibacillus sp. LHD-117]